MVQAVWNGKVIADSDDTIVVEGNHYFPRAAVDAALLSDSATTSFCPWKGVAHYHHVTADGQVNEDAAWYYPDPKEAAAAIAGPIDAVVKGLPVGARTVAPALSARSASRMSAVTTMLVASAASAIQSSAASKPSETTMRSING